MSDYRKLIDGSCGFRLCRLARSCKDLFKLFNNEFFCQELLV